MTNGRIIQEYLNAHGISQAFVARKCGWSRQRTSAILTGKQKLHFEDASAICEALSLPYDYFCNAAQAAAEAAEAEELRRLSAPLVKYLRENHHPHTAIVVTAARAARMEDVMGIPFPIED